MSHPTPHQPQPIPGALIFRIGVLAGLAFAAFLTSSCESTGGPADPNVLRVGVAPNSPPIVFKSGREIVGVEADFARAVGIRLGKTVRFVEMPFERLLPSLQSGKVDVVMSGLTITLQRDTLVDFADPYMISGQAIAVQDSKAYTYAYPQVVFMVEARIGVETGTIADTLVQRRCPKATRVTFSSPQKGFEALSKGSIDVFMHDAPVIWKLAAQYEARNVTPIPKLLSKELLAWAVRTGDEPLRAELNGILTQWKKDGALDRILSKWMPYYHLLPRL